MALLAHFSYNTRKNAEATSAAVCDKFVAVCRRCDGHLNHVDVDQNKIYVIFFYNDRYAHALYNND